VCLCVCVYVCVCVCVLSLNRLLEMIISFRLTWALAHEDLLIVAVEMAEFKHSQSPLERYNSYRRADAHPLVSQK